MINLIKLIILLVNLTFSMFIFFWNQTFWENISFENKLKNLWFDIEELKSRWSVSRYDSTLILNLWECFDCRYPDKKNKQLLNYNYWEEFKKIEWKNFDDISYESTIYWWKDYYYCVAYSANKNFINWYPEQQNSYCPWKFCWSNDITLRELIQIMVNILSNYIYKNYYVNWNNIKIYYDWIWNESIKNKFTNQDITNINKWISRCGEYSCILASQEEFKTFLKYCSFNLENCWFYNIWNLWNSDWSISELNILINEWIIWVNDVNLDDLDKQINWNSLLKLVEKVMNKTNCSLNYDYDKDWFNNNIDNCPNTYNPTQNDFDKDLIWDVCDDDIDDDKILNNIWIVDDQWNIDISKHKINWDNCIYILNPWQEDKNKNWIWDDCENITIWNWNTNWLNILTDKYFWSYPLSIDFTADIFWDFDNVLWDFWNWSYWKGKKIKYTYNSPWEYNVIWKINNWENWFISATKKIFVWDNIKDKFWLWIKLNKSIKWKLSIIEITPILSWEIKNIEWIVDWENKIIDSKSSFSKGLNSDWIYEIIWKWFDLNNEFVAISKANLYLDSIDKSKNFLSYIEINKLNPNINNTISINTFLSWIKIDDINTIEWDFWDWNKISNNNLTMQKIYDSIWFKLIKQKIFLKNWIIIENIVSIYVVDEQQLQSKSFKLLIDSLSKKANQSFNFQINLENITIWEIKSILTNFWDWQSIYITGNFQNSLKFLHKYTYPKNYIVKSYLYNNDWKLFMNRTILNVQWIDICLNKENWFKCDADKDWIVDICDTDIDWDWISNFLWIINTESNNCEYSEKNLNKQKFLEQISNILKWWDIDNCPFQSNIDQIDSNWNWIWDICESIFENLSNDSDNDWLSDDQDLCKDLAENINFFEDQDWCPEYKIENKETTNISVWECNSCPCQKIQFWNQIKENDLLRAVLTDKTWKIIYRYSPILNIDEFSIIDN